MRVVVLKQRVYRICRAVLKLSKPFSNSQGTRTTDKASRHDSPSPYVAKAPVKTLQLSPILLNLRFVLRPGVSDSKAPVAECLYNLERGLRPSQ